MLALKAAAKVYGSTSEYDDYVAQGNADTGCPKFEGKFGGVFLLGRFAKVHKDAFGALTKKERKEVKRAIMNRAAMLLDDARRRV